MKKSLGAKTLLYPTPVLIVGTYDKDGKPNAMTVAWGGICCSEPPCVAISVREATYSYGNLVRNLAFTISLPSSSHVKEVDYFGTASGRNEDKFRVSGLTPVKSDLVNAPYIAEFPMVMECRVIHTFKIGLDTQFMGEILDVKIDEDALGANDVPDLGILRPVAWAPGTYGYHELGNFLGKAFSIGRELRIR